MIYFKKKRRILCVRRGTQHREESMAKYVCQVCGYVHEGDSAPESCPVCKAPAEKFTEQSGEKT